MHICVVSIPLLSAFCLSFFFGLSYGQLTMMQCHCLEIHIWLDNQSGHSCVHPAHTPRAKLNALDVFYLISLPISCPA